MNQTNNKSVRFQITIIGILFFIFGFITWANGTLISYLKIACELNSTQSYYVASAFFAAYFFMAIPSSYILKWTGFKNGMSVGLLIMAIGTALFIPAAQTRIYGLFLTGLFTIGTGLALLQTAANPYVTILGPIESAAQRISIMGICNKFAGILAIYILGSIALKDADGIKAKLLTLSDAEKVIELNALASRVILPYTIIAIILLALAITIYFINMPDVPEEENTNHETEKIDDRTSLIQYPYLLLGAVAIFFYVGVEVINYDTFIGLGEHLGYKLDEAKNFPTYVGYMLLVGYVFNIVAIPKYISQQKALISLTILSIILVILTMFTSGKATIICFMLLGFSNSVMWPAIWPLAIEKLGKFTKIGSALLVMGIVGGAVLPPFYASISEQLGSSQLGYVVMIPCYLYILFYALVGHKIGKR
ncbi:MAG TPA: sugar MFS transporter [Chitinophagales bacterium]|nr:sugar MFS transporter [Chitinophagales bacterium]